jgi:hypothetical protein
MDGKYLITDTRARVYLLWAVLLPLGFVATHYYQHNFINALWTTIAIVGLGFMYKVMPLRVGQMRRIFLAWGVPIGLGMLVSSVVFYIDTLTAATFIGHLGAFWLGVMAVGYFLNGLVDPPSGFYWFAAVINAAACVLCFMFTPFTQVQYLIAAIVSAWSMMNLWLLRTD